MKELFDKYMNIIPNLLKNLRTNMKNMNNNGGIDLYMNLLKISLLVNKVEKENKTEKKIESLSTLVPPEKSNSNPNIKPSKASKSIINVKFFI